MGKLSATSRQELLTLSDKVLPSGDKIPPDDPLRPRIALDMSGTGRSPSRSNDDYVRERMSTSETCSL